MLHPGNVDAGWRKQFLKLLDDKFEGTGSASIVKQDIAAHKPFTPPKDARGVVESNKWNVKGILGDVLKEHTDFIFLTAGWKYNTYWIKKDPTDIFYWIARNKQSGGKLYHFRKIEPIFLFGKPEEKYNFDFFEFNNEYHSADGSEKHACPKPVEFVAEATKIIGRNKIVLDAFVGSGTTIIACEKNRNKCYGMELDPLYCDVIIKRWEDFTGQKAELLK